MNSALPHFNERKKIARRIFEAALAAADPLAAVKRSVTFDGGTISLADTVVNSAEKPYAIFAVAIGKAAFTLASGLDQALGSSLQAGVAVSLASDNDQWQRRLDERWTRLAGGHPLPTEESFRAGRALTDFVLKAEGPNSALIFLISGGGSALAELPLDPRITVGDLARVNSLLLARGVPIYAVNVVRRALSAIKGGGLAGFAPHALKIGLIVSDTNPGDEASVASGPTFPAPPTGPTAAEVLIRHGLLEQVPPIVREIVATTPKFAPHALGKPVANRVLLSSDDAVDGATKAAREGGFQVVLAGDICEQEISEGCRELSARFRSVDLTRPVCLISAGEFRTRVTGSGRGGRSTETALRLALVLAEEMPSVAFTAWLAGTDGIDGNCPAAGAVIDEATLSRARSRGLDPQDFLARSDSYSFFAALDEVIVTGPTGTNVRDIRIILGW